MVALICPSLFSARLSPPATKNLRLDCFTKLSLLFACTCKVFACRTLKAPFQNLHVGVKTLVKWLTPFKDVFMCKEGHHLRSIKDVFMCKERHQPHPTPPQPTPVLRSIKDVFMRKERHHLRSIKDLFMCNERHQPHPTPPQPTPLWPPANGYNHGYIYLNASTPWKANHIYYFLAKTAASLILDWSARYSHIAEVQFTSINCHMRYNMEATLHHWAILVAFFGQLKEPVAAENGVNAIEAKQICIPTSNPNIITPVVPQICFLLNSIAQIKDGDLGIFMVTMVSHQTPPFFCPKKTGKIPGFLSDSIGMQRNRGNFGQFWDTVPTPILDGARIFHLSWRAPPEASAGKPDISRCQIYVQTGRSNKKKAETIPKNSHIQQMYHCLILFVWCCMMYVNLRGKPENPSEMGPSTARLFSPLSRNKCFNEDKRFDVVEWNLHQTLNHPSTLNPPSSVILFFCYEIYINIIYDHYHYTGCLCHVYKVSDEAAELEESAGDPRSAKLLRCISQTHKATYHKDANILCFKTYHQHI